MEQQKSLLRLPLAVLRLITDLLERRDVETFRLVSRACRHVLEPIFFHTLTLHDVTHHAEDINENICDRLCSPKEYLSQCVRHLKIGPFKQKKSIPSVRILHKILLALRTLQDFSWAVQFEIPQDVLNTFQTRWPGARLHVSNTDRINQSLPLDTALLSSPQLHSLHLSILGHRIGGTYTPEFPILSSALISSKSLKSLRLEMATRIEEGPMFSPGPANLQFGDGNTFPALHELALPFNDYMLTQKHCQAWLKAMDWSKLRSLDLDRGAPRYLLENLIGYVPQLKVLKFGFWSTYQVEQLWDCPDLGIVRRFLGKIKGLEELQVDAETESEFEQIKDVVYDTHGRTLHKFKVHCVRAYAQPWNSEKVQLLSQKCPNLQVLTLQLVGDEDTINRHPCSPNLVVAEFTHFPHLEYLNVEIKIAEDSEFVSQAEYNGVFIQEQAAAKHAAALLAYLQEYNKKLERMEVKFVTLDHKYTVTVRKQQEPVGESYHSRPSVFGRNPHGWNFDPFG